MIQILGALLVLAAFVLAQVGVVDQRSYGYLVSNLVGASALAVDAYVHEQWGFLLLEAVWAFVSAWSLAGRLRARTVST
jgi:hypothetical protein